MAHQPGEANGAQGEVMIALQSHQTIEHVHVLQQQLLNGLEQAEVLSIEAAEVEMIDTASIQLLLSAWQEATKRNIRMRIDAPSESFTKAVTLLGAHSMLLAASA